MENRIPRDLDWVNARAQCSIGQVFETLKKEVEGDVNKCNEWRKTQERPGRFSVHKNTNDFTVFWELNSNRQSIIFYLKEAKIEVQNGDHEKRQGLPFEAGLTINKAGECKFTVDDEELESWQFRKLALEKFFFGS